jgi:peptidyl-prolyl cis-trans isomerase A (cyclophilin A)
MRFLHYVSAAVFFWTLVLAAVVQGQEDADNVTTDDNDGLQYVKFTIQLTHEEGTVTLADQPRRKSFVMEVHPEWAPLGAARFLELVDTQVPAPFFAGQRFFRVVEDFIAQFGISGDPTVSAEWRDNTLVDDPVIASNTRGTLTFATAGPNTRTTQLFINLIDNPFLDDSGFAPIGIVYETEEGGMDVVEQLYSGYGDGPPDGSGPDQGRVQNEGTEYLQTGFPLLTYINSVERIAAPLASSQTGAGEEAADETTNNNNEATQESAQKEKDTKSGGSPLRIGALLALLAFSALLLFL